MNKRRKEDPAAALPIEPSLTELQVAAVTGLHVTALAKLRRYGGGPRFFVVGVRVRYRPEAVRAWIEAREVGAMAEHYAKNRGRREHAKRMGAVLVKARAARWPKKAEAAKAKVPKAKADTMETA